MKNEIVSYSYTLKELAINTSSGYYQEDYAINSKLPYDIRSNRLNWEDTLGNESAVINILQNSLFTELWGLYIVPRYWDYIVAISDIDYDFISESDTVLENKSYDAYNKVFGKFWRRFESIAIRTFPYYEKLITLFKSKEADLLSSIKISTTVKTADNETPQTTVTDPYDTKYANHTNVGETVTETEPGTVMQRLEEVRRTYVNLYEKWCNEFDSLFTPNM